MQVAKDEYQTVWMGIEKPNARKVYRGLSRYYDVNYLDELAEAESGWDTTPRFGRHRLDYLPIDLNCLLYKYEMDLLMSPICLVMRPRLFSGKKLLSTASQL